MKEETYYRHLQDVPFYCPHCNAKLDILSMLVVDAKCCPVCRKKIAQLERRTYHTK